jgi:hypothetical protein
MFVAAVAAVAIATVSASTPPKAVAAPVRPLANFDLFLHVVQQFHPTDPSVPVY